MRYDHQIGHYDQERTLRSSINLEAAAAAVLVILRKRDETL